MPAQFVYGVLDGSLINVRDLDPATSRGRLCGCLCKDCERPLQAHMGELRAWHFQHDAEDVDCNPQPMTLLHAYVRDQLALKRELWLPGGPVDVFADVWGTRKHAQITIPDRTYSFSEGRIEVGLGAVRPDVVLKIPDKWDFAVEVRKTHAVTAEKREHLRLQFVDAIEFDVSDLPATGITKLELEKALHERHRWKWLLWSEERRVQSRYHDRVSWELSTWKAYGKFNKVAEAIKPHANARLKQAAKRLPWAQQELARIRAVGANRMDRAAELGRLGPEDRVAVMCAATGIDPTRMPVFFIQRSHCSFNRHAYAWQLPTFAAFGFGQESFTSDELAAWMGVAMPDCLPYNPDEMTKNGFSRTRAAAHSWLLQLEVQGLLSSDKSRRLEDRVFRPCFAGRADFQAFLERHQASNAL